MSETNVTSATGDNTGTTIRTALVWIAGLLLSRQIISEDFYQQFMSGIPFILGVLMLLVPWVQSMWAKWRSRQKTEQAVEVALALPLTATKADVVVAIAKQPDLPMLPKITGSGSTAVPLALLLVVTLSASTLATGCASWRAPVLADVSTATTPAAAKKALAQAQLVRVAVRDSVADAYVAKIPGVDDELVLKIHAIDTKATDYWRRAARIADDWDAIGGEASNWEAMFQAALNELHREILRMQAAAAAGGVK